MQKERLDEIQIEWLKKSVIVCAGDVATIYAFGLVDSLSCSAKSTQHTFRWLTVSQMSWER